MIQPLVIGFFEPLRKNVSSRLPWGLTDVVISFRNGNSWRVQRRRPAVGGA